MSKYFFTKHLIELQKTYNFLDINKTYVFSVQVVLFLKNKILNYLKNTKIIDDLLNNWKEYKFNECAQDLFHY